MVEFDLATYLLTRSGVTDLVSTRIYAVRAPQNTSQNKVQSRIVYKLLAGSLRYYHSEGASGLVEADIELTMTAPTYSQARDIYEAVRNEVDGFSGEWDGTTIDRATLDPPSTASGDPRHADDLGHPAVKAILNVFYKESVPTLGG